MDRAASVCFATVGRCTTSQSVSAIIGRGRRFGTVPFTLLLVPDYLYGVRAVLASVHRGTPFSDRLMIIIYYK